MKNNTTESMIEQSTEEPDLDLILNSTLEEFEEMQAVEEFNMPLKSTLAVKELQAIVPLTPEPKLLDKSKPKTFMPKSFIDPELQVTKDLYAVSYVKLSNKHIMEKSNRLAAYREHVFLVIQTHKKIYRAEVDQHPREDNIDLLVVQMTHELFDDPEHFIRACKVTLRGFIPEEVDLEEAPLHHWTWLVSKEKVYNLLEDIELDRGDNKEGAKPFPYFRPGDESIFRPGKPTEVAKDSAKVIMWRQ